MTLVPYKEHRPKLDESVFLAPNSWVIGKVTLAKDTSVFFGAVLRGDVQSITVGAGTNIQEHALLHASSGLTPCVVGEKVTVGHRAILHGCTIGNECIIGMGAIILDGAEIGEHSIVGAGALVTMNKKFPARSMILGSPAKVVGEVSDAQVKEIQESAERYVELGRTYREYFFNLP